MELENMANVDTASQDQQEPEQADVSGQVTTPGAEPTAQSQEDQTKDQSKDQSGGQSENQTENQPETAQGAQSEQAVPVIPIQFNHEYKELTVSEAANWAQKGMYADKLLADLSVLAAASSAESIPALMKQLKAAHETMLLSKYKEQCGGNEELANKLLEIDRGKWTQRAPEISKSWEQAFQEDANAVNKRLAEEFIKMQKEFGIEKFDQLPAEVVNVAVKNNIPLSDAYLRYQYAQNKQAQAAAENQKAAKQATPGSLKAGEEQPQQSAAVAAMLQGVFG